MATTEQRICHLVAHTCAVDPAVLRRDRTLLAYGLDSIRAVELVIQLEATFGLCISDEDLACVRTVAQIARYIDTRLADRAGAEP